MSGTRPPGLDYLMRVRTSGLVERPSLESVRWWRGLGRPDVLPRPSAAAGWGDLNLWQVLQVGFFPDQSKSETTPGEQFVRALHAARSGFAYLIRGGIGQAAHFVGTGLSPNSDGRETIAALTSSWPHLVQKPVSQAGTILRSLDLLSDGVCATGVPHTGPREKGEQVPPLDRLLQAVAHQQEPWAYVVIGWPVPDAEILRLEYEVADVVSRVKREYLAQGTPGAYNRTAQIYIDLLEDYLKLLAEASIDGGWFTWCYGLSNSPLAARVRSALMLAFAGPSSSPEPFRWHALAGWPSGGPSDDQVTLLSSRRLASMTELPQTEYPGLEVIHCYRFDQVAHTGPTTQGTFELGTIMDGRRHSTQKLDLSVHSMVTHVFATGITGSGKTNTLFGLARHAHAAGVQVLVVEPVKREYRRLGLPQQRIYALGEPGCDLRLNPFAFEGVSCMTHIDHLLALFTAAYVLYAPMPYVLEESIHEIYRDKGWDLTSGTCWREEAGHPRSFPTLTDLYWKIGQVVGRLGYDARLASDIKAALQLRVGNLRLGAKGALLDTRESATIDQLFAQPTCIELEAVGNEEQRAFLIGLFLTKIYEGCVAHGASEDRLVRLLIVEEAHRLLENVSRAQGTDFANPQAKAIQTFANILAEMRAYGLGVIVAEQIPSRIAPEVRKNVATFLVHTLIESEERRLIGGSIGLKEEELPSLAMLDQGEALVFWPGMDRPLQVKVNPFKGSNSVPPVAGLEAQQAAAARAVRCQAAARDLIEVGEVKRALAALALSIIDDDASPDPWLVEEILGAVRRVSPMDLATQRTSGGVIMQVAATWADQFAAEAGRLYHWSFADEQQASDTLRDAMAAILCAPPSANAARMAQESALQVRHRWRPLLDGHCPGLAGCVACERPCRYLAFVRYWLTPNWSAWTEEAIRGEFPYDALCIQANRFAGRLVEPGNELRQQRVAVCYLTQLMEHQPLTVKQQMATVRECDEMIRAGGLVDE